MPSWAPQLDLDRAAHPELDGVVDQVSHHLLHASRIEFAGDVVVDGGDKLDPAAAATLENARTRSRTSSDRSSPSPA